MTELAQEILAGEEAWVVGGALRDELLGRPVVDVDVACRRPERLRFVRGLTVKWTSPEPRGVDSTRVALAAFGAFRLQERYFVWDEGHRNAFMGTALNGPLLRRFAGGPVGLSTLADGPSDGSAGSVGGQG